MRILLIAYEFPPSPSPQSLRWAYLSRELVRAGHEVHVLTADLATNATGLPELPPEMVVHRVFGGPIVALTSMLARRQAAKRSKRARPSGMAQNAGVTAPSGTATMMADVAMAAPAAAPAPGLTVAVRESRLNWKGRLMERIKAAVTCAMFPDERGEWYFPARKAALRLAADFRPDLVVTSHEPATTVQVGLLLKRRFGIPWIADLGDPVLADYTPERWRARSRRLEARLLAAADMITVTSSGTRELLLDRHARGRRDVPAIEVLTQGFDDSGAPAAEVPEGFFDPQRLELLYTGSFYRFRRPETLLDAVSRVPGVRLNIAAVVIPEWLRPLLEANPDQFRLLGFLPHAGAVALQRAADVLVNIANDNPYQVPGKIYEYLGSGRPILHLGNGDGGDASADLVRERRRGWVCDGDPEEMAGLMRGLAEGKLVDRAFQGVELGREAVAEFGWGRLAERLEGLASGVVRS